MGLEIHRSAIEIVSECAEMAFIKLNGKTQMGNVAVVLMTLVVAASCPARTITVDDDGVAAFNTIQAAIDDANDGDTVEIQPGRYTGSGNRDIDFKGKAITVRSKSGPEDCIIDCGGDESNRHRAFYFHNAEAADSVVSGLTIQNGCAPVELTEGLEAPLGGAIFCYRSNPTISDCVIKGSTIGVPAAGYDWGAGAGIYSRDANTVIADCIIEDNGRAPDTSPGAPATFGGGIHVEGGFPRIVNCKIRGNKAGVGGGLSAGDCGLVVLNCVIEGNVAGDGGGVVFFGNLTIADCTIRDNEAITAGGGVAWFGADGGIMETCVVSNNLASGVQEWGLAAVGGGIFCNGSPRLRNCTICFNRLDYADVTGAVDCNEGTPIISNCIIWGNDQAQIRGGTAVVAWSNVQGGWPGTGNIDADPCFALHGHWDDNGTPGDSSDDFLVHGDYHLKSRAGRWEPTAQGWVFDNVTSACIDAGDISGPVGRERFPNGGIINMGAYGGTIEASKSYFAKPTCPFHMVADINDDCTVDALDLRIMLAQWLKRCQTAPSGRVMMFSGDLDCDCSVDRIDFAILANSWRERYRP